MAAVNAEEISDQSASSSEEIEELTAVGSCKKWTLYVLKFQCLRGATYLNILELISCLLVII